MPLPPSRVCERVPAKEGTRFGEDGGRGRGDTLGAGDVRCCPAALGPRDEDLVETVVACHTTTRGVVVRGFAYQRDAAGLRRETDLLGGASWRV